MWKFILLAVVGVVLGPLVVLWRERLRRRRLVLDAVAAWRDTATDRRRAEFDRRVASGPPSAANWYLLGCAHLREGDIAAAARAFGMAHHVDYRLETAALLTFACLKESAEPAHPAGSNGHGSGRAASLIGHVVQTWEEMRRPPLGRHPRERTLLHVVSRESASPNDKTWTADEVIRHLLDHNA